MTLSENILLYKEFIQPRLMIFCLGREIIEIFYAVTRKFVSFNIDQIFRYGKPFPAR